MKIFALFILSIFLSAAPAPATRLAQEFKSSGKKSSVKVLGDKFHYSDEISLLVNGELSTTGDCSPRLKLGLLRKKEGQTWDTLVDIKNLGVLMCGFGTHTWKADTVTTSFAYHYPAKAGADYPGTYCFTYMLVHRGKTIVKATNEFAIEP